MYRVTHQVVPKLSIQGWHGCCMGPEFWNNLMCHPVVVLVIRGGCICIRSFITIQFTRFHTWQLALTCIITEYISVDPAPLSLLREGGKITSFISSARNLGRPPRSSSFSSPRTSRN